MPADLLHIHYGMFGIVGLVAKLPFLLHFHGSDLLQDDLRRPYAALHRAAARRAAACLVSTPDLLAFEDSLGVALRFLPNPTVVRKQGGGEEDGRGILFGAKVDVNKNPAVFLAAARELVEDGRSVTVLGFGGEAHKFRRELQAIECRGGRVLWERLPQTDFSREVADASLVVGQFGVGAFGMTELTAFGMAKPVVTHFAFQRAYSTHPAYEQAKTISEIREAVTRLELNSEKARSLGRAAQEWVAREHALSSVIALLEAIYGEVGVDARRSR
jgi:hypothetical protein